MIGFFKRLRDGLLDPKAVTNYLADKIIYPILVLLFFGVVLTIPNLIRTYNYTMPYEMRSAIQGMVVGKDLNYRIENGVLLKINTDEDVALISNGIAICFFDAKIDKSVTYIVRFREDGIYLGQPIVILNNALETKLFEYNDFEKLKNFDISKLKDANSDEWNTIFDVYNDYYKSYRSIYMIYSFVETIMSRLMMFVLLIVIFAFSQYITLRKQIKFFALTKINVYYLVPYFLTSLLSASINVSIIGFVGIIVCIIYVNIGKIELIKKIYKSHPEG